VDIAYRPARPEDIEPAAALITRAVNDLRARHGLPPSFTARPSQFARFCLTQDSDGLWAAEAAGALVGFGFAWVVDGFWFLAQLFVKPDVQARGIGQELLSRTLAPEKRHGTANRALITFAYNRTSTALYIRNGMYPREPLYRMEAPAELVAARLSKNAYQTAPAGPEAPAWMARIDEAVLGFRRDTHHGFLGAQGTPRAIRITASGEPVGYAYIFEGHIGPLAIAPTADAAAVVAAAVQNALVDRPQRLSMIVPGAADHVLRLASGLGFRIEDALVLLAARPFGDWRHYLPSNPGYM
jgi:ribosomal protein S18 acetylase RimI-like enzyme